VAIVSAASRGFEPGPEGPGPSPLDREGPVGVESGPPGAREIAAAPGPSWLGPIPGKTDVRGPGPGEGRGPRGQGGQLGAMAVQFTVLASGSRGNATLLRAGGRGMLIDLGLGPRAMADRLSSVGATWDHVSCALLTHTHGDHVCDASLRRMARKGIAFYCHEAHRGGLSGLGGFRELERVGCLRLYDDRPFLTPAGLQVEPVELSHDGPTFGFRLEGRSDRKSRPVSLAYLADTGCWTDAMADALCDVGLLGIEFNHDEEMQRQSGRSWALIKRNLGPRGHLSNAQGAGLLGEVLRRSRAGAVRHVVLLHLSEQCNRPELAVGAARDELRRAGSRAEVHAAGQWFAYPDLRVVPGRRPSAKAASAPASGFPWEAA
jgi:phosphoribosyl 1,2-cyclic phosphodiesterase